MASSSSIEKPFTPSPPSSSTSSTLPAFLQPAANVFTRFSTWRSSLALPPPGTVESLLKEVKSTHLTNFLFDGARADLTKALSVHPAFQVTHSFSLASQNSPPSYNFGAVFANENVFLQGGVDHEGQLTARVNWGWSPNNVTKIQGQLSDSPSMNMFHLEQDYQGSDYSLNAKCINASPIDFSGIYIGEYLQSITKNTALGVQSIFQNSPQESGVGFTYLMKYTGTGGKWIATTQLTSSMMQTTYWQKLSDKVDVAADLQIISAPGKRDAVATLGAKYDLRMSTFRAQVDSLGRVSALLEQRFAPTFAFLVGGEIDHFRNTARIGVGVMIESSSLTPEEMGVPPPGQHPYSAPMYP